MALKTFNLDEKTYKEYSDYCKKEGISMSKRVEQFIKAELENLKSNKSKNSKTKTESVQPISLEGHSFAKYC